MNNSMLGSLSEFCRSAMSSQEKFNSLFKKKNSNLLQSKLLLKSVVRCNPQKINRAGVRKPTICALEQVLLWFQVYLWLWMSGESVTPQGCLCFVWGLLGGYRSEHTWQAREEGGPREMGGVHTLIYPETNSMRRELKIGPSAYCNPPELTTPCDSQFQRINLSTHIWTVIWKE